jgi:hypothetical protein
VIHADAFGGSHLINAALLAGPAMFLGAKVILEGSLVIRQNIDSVLNVQLFDGLFRARFVNLLRLFSDFALFVKK